MNDFEVTAGKQMVRQGDTGVRGSLVFQLVGATKNKAGAMVKKIKLNSFKYDVVQEADATSGLTVPVVYQKSRKIDAQEGDRGAVFDGGKWVVKLERRRLDPDYPDATDLETRYKGLMDTEIYFQCKVLWPEASFGQVVPLSTAIGGIEFPHGPNQLSVNFITDGQWVSKLMKLATAFGFDPAYFTPGSPIYDAQYLEPYVRDFVLPITKVTVVEQLLVPLLVRHAQQGRLVRGETSDNSHFIMARTVKPVGEAEAAAIWAQAKEWEKKDEEPEPDAPFFDDDDKDTKAETDPVAKVAPDQAKTGEEAERLRAEVRALGVGNDNFAWDVSKFLDEQQISYDDESLLSSLTVAALKQVIAHFESKKAKKPSL